MRRLVTDDRKRVGAWVAERVGRNKPWESEPALGLEKDGELIAGIVIGEVSVGVRGSMHAAGTGKYWLNREFLFAAFDYAFRVLGLKVLYNSVAGDNVASLRFTRHIGFQQIDVAEKAWDGEKDLVLFKMTPAMCRWLRSA